MESLAKQNLEQKLGMVETAIGVIAYERLKAQKRIEMAEDQIKLCDLKITMLESEQTVIAASLNDIKVDIASADRILEEATQKVDEVTAKLKKARKRK